MVATWERSDGSIGDRGSRSRPHFRRKDHDLSFCVAPKDADGTYVKRDPIIVWQSVVAFAPRGLEAAER